MKKIFLIGLLVTSTSYSNVCPRMEGQFHCMLSNGEYSLLTITQKTLSGPTEKELEQYTFAYSAIPGGDDSFNASVAGELDDLGWTTRCVNNRLRTMPSDARMISELYIDAGGAYIYAENGHVINKCPRKQSQK